MKIHIPAFALALIATAFLTASSVVTGQNGSEEPLLRVRVVTFNKAQLLKELEKDDHDVVRMISPIEFDVVISRQELDKLVQRGVNARIVEQGRPLQQKLLEQQQRQQDIGIAAVPSGYRDLNGVIARMQEIANANSSIARVVDLTATFGAPTTFQGRHIFALKISDNVNVDEDEPAVMLVSAHHVREIVTPVIALDAAERLTSGYGNDARITAAVNNNEIWIAPVWNPDGYNHVFTVDNLWRKNRRVFTSSIGVDLNRNYPQGWTASCAGSTSPSSDTYKGPSAGSEAETQAMIIWSEAVRFAKVMDYHSSGREVLSGYLCLTHPHTTWMRGEATALSQASGYGGAIRAPSAEGEQYQRQFAKLGAYAFLTETHSEFQPSFSSAQAEAARVFPGFLRMIERPIPLSGHVTDAVTGSPVSARIEITNVTFPNGETNSSGGAFGAYHFFGPSNTYNIRFSATGYTSETRNVAVNTNTATVLNVQLTPSGGGTDVFTDDFETNKNWTVNPNGTDTATTGRWERGNPESTSSSGAKQLGTTPSGVNDLVTGRLAGASAGTNDIDGGLTSIQSPAITLPGSGNLTLSFNFYLAHTSTSSTDDFFRVRIVGTTTQTVFERRGAAANVNAVFTPASVSLNAFAGQTVRVLIEAADNASGSIVEAAVDDLKITRQ